VAQDGVGFGRRADGGDRVGVGDQGCESDVAEVGDQEQGVEPEVGPGGGAVGGEVGVSHHESMGRLVGRKPLDSDRVRREAGGRRAP
jgi:hypothetical protein